MRVKRGVKARRRRNKFLARASGFYSSNSKTYSHAREKGDRAMAYMFRDRKQRKRQFRRLWTVRINAAARMNGTTYSRLMHALKEKDIQLDRKILAELALTDAPAFAQIVKQVLPSSTPVTVN